MLGSIYEQQNIKKYVNFLKCKYFFSSDLELYQQLYNSLNKDLLSRTYETLNDFYDLHLEIDSFLQLLLYQCKEATTNNDKITELYTAYKKAINVLYPFSSVEPTIPCPVNGTTPYHHFAKAVFVYIIKHGSPEIFTYFSQSVFSDCWFPTQYKVLAYTICKLNKINLNIHTVLGLVVSLEV